MAFYLKFAHAIWPFVPFQNLLFYRLDKLFLFRVTKHFLSPKKWRFVRDLCDGPIIILVVHELLLVKFEKLSIGDQVFLLYPCFTPVPVNQVGW